MANVFDVASFFIEIANANEDDYISNLKLQKLLYFAQGWNLALNDKKLFEDKIEAWKYGPVVSSIYYAYNENKSNPIYKVKNGDYTNLSAEDIELLSTVQREYGKYSGNYLVALTHEEDTPWRKSIKNNNCYIDENDIKNYFKEKKKIKRFSDYDISSLECIEEKRDADGILVLPKDCF